MFEPPARWLARLLSIIEAAYDIAKNASTLHTFQAELSLLPKRFQIEDTIAHTFLISILKFIISFACYC